MLLRMDQFTFVQRLHITPTTQKTRRKRKQERQHFNIDEHSVLSAFCLYVSEETRLSGGKETSLRRWWCETLKTSD